MIKESQVGSHKGKCVSAMLWAAEGGGEIVIKGMFFDKRSVVVESMGCRWGGGNFDKRKSGRVAQRQMCVGYVVGCRGGGNCDKRNVFDKRNVVVESMGCRGGGKL